MGKNGGARPGAGRPKASRTIAAEMFKDYVAKRIVEEQGDIVDALLEKAKKGDTQAAKELFDRAFGKSKESVDVTTKGESLNTNLKEEPNDELAARLAAIRGRKAD
jgi:hypothetical protein